MPDVPGPEAGPAQGGGVIELHQGEAGEGVLSLDLSALGQRQKETWRKRVQRTDERRPGWGQGARKEAHALRYSCTGPRGPTSHIPNRWYTSV